MESEYVFREMQIADLPQVIEIEQSSFPDPWTTKVFRQELTENPSAFYTVLVDREDRVVGYCGFWVVLDEAQITKVAMHAIYRGLGLGARLLIYCMEQSRLLGAIAMTLEVRASNFSAQRLYQKLGFASAGIRPRFYKICPEDAMIMWVRLDEETNHTRDRNELR